jgi:hypothetical protein
MLLELDLLLAEELLVVPECPVLVILVYLLPLKLLQTQKLLLAAEVVQMWTTVGAALLAVREVEIQVKMAQDTPTLMVKAEHNPLAVLGAQLPLA